MTFGRYFVAGCCCTLLALPCLATTTWPLPIPTNTSIQQMSDFHGALYRLGNEAIQIDTISWMISPEGNLAIHSLHGFRADGTEYFTAFGLGSNRGVNNLQDFHDFRLRRGFDSLVVTSIDWEIDSHGYLQIQAMGGTTASDGEIYSYMSDDPVCGLHVQQSCDQARCVGGICGSAPMCACPGEGGCDPTTYTYCDGSCSSSRICNQSTTQCGCIDPPPPPPPPPGGGRPAPPAPVMEWCPPDMPADPMTGNCAPGTCWLCNY
jgi:hypothetical protein